MENKNKKEVQERSPILDLPLATDDTESLVLMLVLIIITLGFFTQEFLIKLVNKHIELDFLNIFAKYIIHLFYSIVYGSLFIYVYYLGVSISFILYGCLIYLGILVLILLAFILYIHFKKKTKIMES